MPNRRLLLVHAHPDDETIGTGITMAAYAQAGDGVTLVTCTLGDEGEILVPELAHLAADAQDGLAAHRHTELAAAMDALGVTDWRILGGPGAYRDSGMMGTPPNNRPDNFWQADVLDAARHLVAVIREVQPQVLVTYDDFGGYGHPDHIKAHRVAMYAMQLAAAPSFEPQLGQPWAITKVYWTAFPRSVMVAGIEALRAIGQDTEFAAVDPDELPFLCADELVTTAISAPEMIGRKNAAMKAHATQINTEEGFFALSNNIGGEVLGIEYFRLVQGIAAGPFDDSGHETDLFSGLGLS
jgi:N-acetyl-1-D-myo-inositol-2-amino-2-deoxy-alpha-D-glucopyranoside deacetylase